MYFYPISKHEEENEATTEEQKKEETKEPETKQSSPCLIYRRRNLQAFEGGSDYTLSLDLPGVKSTDLKVEFLDEGVLQVEAERTSGKATKTVQQFSFDKTKIDKGNIQANLVDGVLTITIAKKEDMELEPLAITINAGFYVPEETEEGESPSKKLIKWSIDLPGVKLQDLKVELNGDQLSLKAERRQGETVVAKTDRSFTVDSMKVDTTKLEGFLSDGVLTLVAEKKELDPPLSVAIGTSADESEPQKQQIEAEVEVSAETVDEDDED